MSISKLLFVGIMVCIAANIATAQKAELTPYGFIKGDAVFASEGVLSFGNPSLVAPQHASGLDTGALGFTAQHTRFGLKGSIGDEDLKAGGLVELDFFGSSFETNLHPRMRLAYAWVQAGNFEARFGQQWDIFSPNNASTANTNGNMWFGGNLGFRRAMIQLIYSMPMGGVTPKLQLGLCEGTKEASGLGADNWAKMPMIQGRLSAKFGDGYDVGGAFVYASHSPVPDDSEYDFNSTGFGGDFNLPFHELLALKGEVNVGTNLANATLFSIAGKHIPSTEGVEEVDRKNMAVWLNATSHLHEKLILVLGFGMDQNTADDADFMVSNLKSNTVIYGDIIFPVKHGFSITLEVESISSEVVTMMVNNVPETTTQSALVVILSGKLNF
jgi:hypothetical protein